VAAASAVTCRFDSECFDRRDSDTSRCRLALDSEHSAIRMDSRRSPVPRSSLLCNIKGVVD